MSVTATSFGEFCELNGWTFRDDFIEKWEPDENGEMFGWSGLLSEIPDRTRWQKVIWKAEAEFEKAREERRRWPLREAVDLFLSGNPEGRWSVEQILRDERWSPADVIAEAESKFTRDRKAALSAIRDKRDRLARLREGLA